MATSYRNNNQEDQPNDDRSKQKKKDWVMHSKQSKKGEKNPLREADQAKIPEPCILVIFGASGDLTAKKILPAIFNLMHDGALPHNFAVVGIARRDKNNEDFRKEAENDIRNHSRNQADDAELHAFTERLFYYCANFDDDNGYQGLDHYLKDLDKKFNTKGNRIFYLSVQPSYFETIAGKLKQHKLICDSSKKDQFTRVIIEKPFGHDYRSAIELRDCLSQHLDEKQIYRIDHYLGKETVQNLLVFRFGNAIFDSLWNNRYVEHIQITVAEDIGVEERGAFYEKAGVTRDVVQNHLMQLLSLIAMEPPTSLEADAIRNEKVKVMEGLRHYRADDIEKFTVRGQYTKGFVEGDEVKAYREEDRVDRNSNVETFAAMKLKIDNWRWFGVPIYVRAGKRLAKRKTEIVLTFKATPPILFHEHDQHKMPNQIIFKIQPNEGIKILFNTKVPGSQNLIQPVTMDFENAKYFGLTSPEAYERLIHDCMLGDTTLFARVDEALNSWKFITPILEHWSEKPLNNDLLYKAGTAGPKAAEDLIRNDGRKWKNL